MTDWNHGPAKTKPVLDYLERCAREMRTVTYKEVGEACEIAPVGLGRQLAFIRDEVCRARGLPWLTAIVVQSANDRRPGEGFVPEGTTFNSHDAVQMWRGMVLQVFATEWGAIE